MFSIIDNYHTTTEGTNLSIHDLANLIFATISKDHPYYQGVIQQLESLDVTDSSTKVLVKKLCQNEKLKSISLTAYEITEGRKSVEDLNTLLAQYQTEPEVEEETDDFMTDDIELVVNRSFSKPGLKWRLNTLNKMLGSLRPGDFGFIFSRPEVGKTTLLSSEITYMATQIPDDQGPVIWLANEEDVDKVIMRVYQAAFGITLANLNSDLGYWREEFRKLIRGKLKLIKDTSANKTYIEKLCKKYSPSLVVIDQLSKVKGFSDDRKDLELGQATTWARDLAKQGRPVIAIHQAGGTAEGVKWLNMGHVADAKTAMQADADWILGVGKSNEPGYEMLRYFALSKNKLTGDADITDPALRHGHVETLIDPTIARYKDL